MLHTETLSEISRNTNTGVEYEIALFYQLLKIKPDEQSKVMEAIRTRSDADKINAIIAYTKVAKIEKELRDRGLELVDASFETQNDKIGPADIVMYVKDHDEETYNIGLSVKYSNKCSFNVTGRHFIPDDQIAHLRAQLPDYTKRYIKEMTKKYGDVSNWFRKRKASATTDQFVDQLRDAVVANWPNVTDKTTLLSALFHSDSPIEFWVVTYTSRYYRLRTHPQTIDMSRAADVTVAKHQTSYVAFYLDGTMVAHMQVKFNNGFIEECKKKHPDVVCQGVDMAYGQPFSSWNFCVEK